MIYLDISIIFYTLYKLFEILSGYINAMMC